MTDAPRIVAFGNPLAENSQEKQKTNLAVKLLGYGLGIPALLGILVSGAVITGYALSFAVTWAQWFLALAMGIASTLCIATMPVAAELNETPHGKATSWVVFWACLSLGVIACVAYGITAPTSKPAPTSVATPDNLPEMKTRLAQIDIDPRPEPRIIEDIECLRQNLCRRRPVYSWGRLQDELEARHLENAIAKIERTRGAQTHEVRSVAQQGNDFLAAATKASANGLNWALPALALLICAAVVAVLAGALASVMTGLTKNPTAALLPSQPAEPETEVVDHYVLWHDECVIPDAGATGLQYKSIRQNYEEWCKMSDFLKPPIDKDAFAKRFSAQHGDQKAHSGGANIGGTIYNGIRLKKII